MKKLYSLLLVLVLALAMVGCTDNDPKEDPEIDCEVEECTYTFRSAGGTVSTLNPHMYQMSTEASVLSTILSSFYTSELILDGSSERNYDYINDMAAGDPVCVDDNIVDNKCFVWEVTIKNDLTFHDGTEIDIYTFVDTYKLLLDPNYKNYRANSFWSGFVVENAKSYFLQGSEIPEEDKEEYNGADIYPDTSWDEVGIKATGDYTIQFTLSVPEKADEEGIFKLKGRLSSFIFGPVDVELYEEHSSIDPATGFRTTNYGSTLDKLNGHGVYKLVQWDRERVRRYERWDEHNLSERAVATNLVDWVYKDSTTVPNVFEEGNLDVMSVPSAKYEQYKDNPFLKKTPSAATWSLRLNANGRQDIDQPAVDALMGNDNFRKALYFAIDRSTLQENKLQFSKKSQYLVSSAFLSDELGNVSYRETEEATSVYEDYFPETFGYNQAEAKRLYDLAREEIAISHGIPVDEKIIVEIQYGKDSAVFSDVSVWLSDQLVKVFGEDNFGVKIQQIVNTAIYDNMIAGKYDIGIGAWVGGLTDPWGMMEVYTSSFDKQLEFGYRNRSFDTLYEALANDKGGYLEEGWETAYPELLDYVQDGIIESDGYVNGLKFASKEIRLGLLAIQEKMLLEDMVVIPLFESVNVLLYHERIELPLSEPLPLVGYGSSRMTIGADEIYMVENK